MERRNSRFVNILAVLGTVFNTYAQVARAQSCANQVQHIERSSVCHVVRRDSSAVKFDRVEIAFILAIFYRLKSLYAFTA